MTREELKMATKADCFRYINEYNNNPLKVYLRCPGFRYTYWMRKVSYWKSKGLLGKYLLALVPYYIYRRMTIKYGITIDNNIPIGSGLMIVHQGGVFVNAVSIGNNVTIYQNVTIGSGKTRYDIPTIEDEVTIYTGAVVYGNIHIRKRAIIAPNAAVCKDVEESTLVGGIPAHVIKRL